MFIVNQEGNRCEKVQKVYYEIDKLEGLTIYINDSEDFGSYFDISEGIEIFNNIVECLSKDILLYDLSKKGAK